MGQNAKSFKGDSIIKRVVRVFEPRVKFLRLIPEGGMILDCGCGDFRSTNKLRQERPDLRWYCIDRNNNKNVPDGIVYVTCDLEQDKIPYDDCSFDAAIALHVVEHITNLRFFCGELHRITRPGGYIFIEVPSVTSMFMPASNFFDDVTHKKPFTKISLRVLLAEYIGIQPVKIKTVRNVAKAILTPLLMVYSLMFNNHYYMIGLGEIVGSKLYGFGKKSGSS